MEYIIIDNIGKSAYNNKFIEFKASGKTYVIDRDSIKSIVDEFLFNDGVEDISLFKVETDSYLFAINSHNVDEMKRFLLTDTELSFDWYCRDTQRMLRGLLSKNYEMIQKHEEALRELAK